LKLAAPKSAQCLGLRPKDFSPARVVSALGLSK